MKNDRVNEILGIVSKNQQYRWRGSEQECGAMMEQNKYNMGFNMGMSISIYSTWLVASSISLYR